MSKYQSHQAKIKKNTKKQHPSTKQKIDSPTLQNLDTRQRIFEKSSNSKSDSQDDVNDESENEYDEEEDQDSDDKYFIADDDEVLNEIEEAKKRQKKEQKKQQKLEKIKSENQKRNLKHNYHDNSDLEEDDYELINENNQKPKKLKKLNDIQDDLSENSILMNNKQQNRFQKQNIFDDEDDDENQIYSSNRQNRNIKNLKQEINQRQQGLFDQSNNQVDDLQRKQQIFKRKREDSTAEDDERQSALHQKQLQNLKDKFVVEDIDDLFCTQQDQEILNRDIPERLQLKLQDRFKPTQEELGIEAQWIFDNIIESLPSAKESLQQQKIQAIQSKIQLTLQYFRCDNIDIPQIISSRMKFLTPELDEDSIWQLFNLDIEYGKYEIQKRQIKIFFEQIKKLSNQSDEIQNYINSIYYIRNQRDLRDYEALINFYKAYYRRELESIAQNDGKKLPIQKNNFVQNARDHKYDEFSKKFVLSPPNFVENIQEDKLIHKPYCPQQKMKDLAKDYININNKEPIENSKIQDQLYLNFIEEVCKFAAVELQCQPELRKIMKKYVKENGTIVTQPTEKGMKELDVLHSSYRVKRVNKRIQDIDKPDIFLDIIQNESVGFITYEIQVEKIEEFYNNIFEKYQSLEIISEHQKKWQIARNEIKKQFCCDPNPMNKQHKTILQTIIDEIKDELREDSENYILKQCKEKYQSLIQMGYFKIRDDQKVQQQNERKGLNELSLIDDNYIQQRERLNVMGAILHPIDNRNFMTTIAIVNQYGELVAHRDFFNLLPPRVRRLDNNQQEQQRPGEIEEKTNHEKCKRQFQEMLRQHQVDLIVVSADCLEARKLKKCLGELASFKNYQDNDHSMDNPKNEEIQEFDNKEAYVIWGRSEIPKLFAQSHQSQKLLKNMPFVLKKAICLARFEQDPMNEILNLWSPIISENQSLNINLHPLQKLINKARLMDCLEEVNVSTVNLIGIDINILIDHEHQYNQMQFLSGLGPRKAQKFIQKLKQRGRPLYNRMDIWECKIIEKSCFMSCVNFLKVRIPFEKRTSEPVSINILDQTRINPRDYELMQRIATYCIFGNEDFQNIDDLKKIQAINELLRNPEKLKDIQNCDFKDQFSDQKILQSEKRQNESRIDQNSHIDKIIKDFMYPFKDPREDKNIVRTFDDQKFPSNELFYCLIDETERTFKKGIIVSANVIKVYQSNGNQQARILCRLENGLDANINENDADFFGSVNIGSIVQGRVDQIKQGQSSNDENFSVNLKCKQSDLRRHDLYAANLENVPEQDLVNLNFKVQEEQTQLQKKLQIQKRKIQHARFQNISSTIALQQLKREDNGEYYFRPSSRGIDNLTLTWKFYENNVVHIDIRETEKAIGANIGSKLWINEESFDNLQEIVERYITQCNRLVREVTQHSKFYKCNNMDELNHALLKEKTENDSSIPYKFTILDEYPQYVILAYVPKKDVVREFIKVKPKGYFFHHQYQYPFQNMINWFKKSFKTREYQYYLRKAQSPQRVIQLAGQLVINQPNGSKPENDINGMQIDSGQIDNDWGSNVDQNNVKKEYASKQKINQRNNNEDCNQNGWGDQPTNPQRERSLSNQKSAQGWCNDSPNKSNVKDEREKEGNWGDTQNNFQSPQRSERNYRGGNRGGRGGQNNGGGGRSCFKCGQEGHFSRECPNQDNNYQGSKQKGMGRGGGGPNKCYNCDQQGHMSKDCTEPKKERTGGNKCFNCNNQGHMSRDCPEPKKERGVQKCYNCQQDGHMSRDCPEPRQERRPRNGGDDQQPYKRQRNDEGGSFRRQNNQSGWKNGDEQNNDWNKNNQNNQQDNGWGNTGEQKEPASNGWGNTNDQKEQTFNGGWENTGEQKEQTFNGGWENNIQDTNMISEEKDNNKDVWGSNNNVTNNISEW